MTQDAPVRTSGWRRALAASLRSASRVGAYSLATRLIPRGRKPTGDQRRAMGYFLRQAYALHRGLEDRSELMGILQQLERDDLRDLPLFVLSVPFDLWRTRRKHGGQRRTVVAADAFPYPDYYLHDFHNQVNGGLSRRAAATYEWQIRFLFMGTNRLMRQRVIDALPTGSGLEVLDLGCGTAAWLPQARMQGRGHAVTGVDLSPFYLERARARGDSQATFKQMNAEELPAAWRGRFDRIVCIWTYHELPAEAQRRVTANMAAALKPGGEVLFMDAIQQRDIPGTDLRCMNEDFAADFDEPYFADYQRLDLAAHFGRAGLKVREKGSVFVSNFYRLGT